MFASPAASETPHLWTHLDFHNDPRDFQSVIVGDRTGRYRPGVFEKGIAKLSLLRPEFVLSVWDLIEGYAIDEAETWWRPDWRSADTYAGSGTFRRK